MKNSYLLDATIVSILFNIQSEEESEKLFAQFEEMLEKIQSKALSDYLLEAGHSEEVLMNFFSSDEPDKFPEVLKSMESVELVNFVNSKISEFNKRIYDDQIPKMSEQQKVALEKYLAELNAQNDKTIDEMISILQTPSMATQADVNTIQSESTSVVQ